MKQTRAKGKTPPAAFGSFGGFGAGAGSGSTLSYLAEPPSLTAVDDANVVVALKNVLKKDATTKAKGLEELAAHARSRTPTDASGAGGVDEALLDVWTQVYPRTAVDNGRRVRELAHGVQAELARSARRRMEKRIPSVVGAWLAGLYDRDRGVARAASDGLGSLVSDPEKADALWRRCQARILDYAAEAVGETRDSLSDERSTTPEDAEAKFHRVVAAGLALVLALLQKMPDAELDRCRDRYDAFFEQDAVWRSITLPDSQVQKTACQLLFACINRRLPYADDTRVRQAFITGGLRTPHPGSALEYIIALTKLSQHDPRVWAPAGAADKKSPVSRFHAFVAKGSQGSSARFWDSLDQLIGLIPTDLLLSTGSSPLAAASSLLTSLRSGATNREEPRIHAPSSWKCFVSAAQKLLAALDSSDDRLSLARDHLFPLFDQFLFPSAERPASQLPPGNGALAILVQAYQVLAAAGDEVSSAFASEWDRLASELVSDMSKSLPEVSKEYQTSQDRIGDAGKRWFGLVGQIHKGLDAAADYTAEPSDKVISQCLSLLETRNLKPSGAARVVEHALDSAPHLFSGPRWDLVSRFLISTATDDMAKAVDSPSSRHLLAWIRLLASVGDHSQEYTALWQTWADAALALESTSSARNSTLASLISFDKGAELAKGHKVLQDAVLEQAVAATTAEEDEAKNAWDLLDAAVAHGALDDKTYSDLAHKLVDTLDKGADATSSSSANVLRALEVLVKARPDVFATDDKLHTALVAKLLGLSELADGPVSSQSRAIRALLDSNADGKLPVVGIIQSNLDRATSQSLEYVNSPFDALFPDLLLTPRSIETIASQAQTAANVPLEDLFPSTNAWMQELTPLFRQPVNSSLSITSSVGGAVALVKPEEDAAPPVGQRDAKGRSVPARMALYLNRILDGGLDLSGLPVPFQVELLYLHWTTAQIVSDQVTTMGRDGPWKSLARADDLSEAEELVSRARSHILSRAVLPKGAADAESVASQLMDLLLENAAQLTPQGLYSSRCLLEMVQANVEAHGLSAALEERLLKTETLKATPATVLVAASAVAGLGEAAQSSKQVSNLCNRLVSDLAGAAAQTDKAHMGLVLLTACGAVYERGALPVANNRLVFAVRQLTSWLEDDESMRALSPDFSADVCRALTTLLPCIKDVYGSYWEKSLGFCNSLWARAGEWPLREALAPIHASLKLARALETLEEPNDDLEDALKEFAEPKAKALVELLKLPRDEETSSSPPLALSVVDAMVCREMERLPMRHMPELADLFPLVASDSREIQTAAFGLLHRAIPEQQAQKSVDVLLDKTEARLPDELLSLLLDAPTLDSYSDEALARFPAPVRAYLLAWVLVFDAFSTSSHKVRGDLSAHLKAEGAPGPLLDFTTDVLGHSAAHALRLDRAGLAAEERIRGYDVRLADAETDERAMQWLLVHLFHLTLKYTPALFRSWFIDCRSKQTRIAVEAWTTRYFSPLAIDDALDEVQLWIDGGASASTDPDEQDLIVKVSRPAREVTAGYEVDESQAAIAIKIPPSYPLEGVTVAGLRRVAVSERKWQSWIMTTQGVITFSNGNIIDGLQVFRRNIAGALKGQAECAICYSIISTDQRMPDKRCTTCRNLFHRTCLYKWFQTSNQNTCPLCRNPIDYLGADTQKRRQ